MKTIQILAVALVASFALPSCTERHDHYYPVYQPKTKTVYKKVPVKPRETAENFEAVR